MKNGVMVPVWALAKSCVHVTSLKTASNNDLGGLYPKEDISDMLIMSHVVSWELLTPFV